MPSINRAEVMGHLGRDVEVKYLPSGQPVANFSVATTEFFKGRDGADKESTEWHNVVVYGKQAELCSQYLKKGALVFVEGRLATRSWDKGGIKQYRTEVVAQRVHFLGKAGGQPSGQSNSAPNGGGGVGTTTMPDDDIPFITLAEVNVERRFKI